MDDWYGLSYEDRADLLLSINLGSRAVSYRRPLSPLGVAKLFHLALKKTNKETLASELNLRDASMITRLLSILKFDDDLRALVGWGRRPGQVAMAVALEGGIASIRPNKAQRSVFEAAMKHNFTKAEAQAVGQFHRRDFGNVDECIAEALKSRPKVVHNEVFVGAILEPELVDRLREMEPDDRDTLLSNAISSVFPDIRTISIRLNEGYYSFVVSERWAKIIKKQTAGQSREKIINEAIKKLTEV